MTTVLATHEINDSAHWLASPKRAELGEQLGVKFRTFLNPQNSNSAAVLIDLPDGMTLDDLLAFMQTPMAAEAMVYDGVRGDTMVTYVEA
jgi:hypothetical protein